MNHHSVLYHLHPEDLDARCLDPDIISETVTFSNEISVRRKKGLKSSGISSLLKINPARRRGK